MISRQTQSEELSSILKSVEWLEEQGKILLCIEEKRIGMILDHEMSDYFNLLFLEKVSRFSRYCGIKTFFKACNMWRKFSRRHDPDEDLINLCANVRIAMTWRAQHDGISCDVRNLPLFLTFMSEDMSCATMTGYEINGDIVLEPSPRVQ